MDARAAGLLVLFAALGLHGQRPETIRVPVRLVSAPTLVLSKNGRVVEGLQVDDFRLLDNGVQQKLSLDTDLIPPSVAIAIQANSDVRDYVPFIRKVGSVVDDLLLGGSGTATVLSYNDEVKQLKPFDGDDVRPAFHKISSYGSQARMIDAGLQGIDLLKEQPMGRSRILLLIGQSLDHGSQATLEVLKQRAEEQNVSIYSLALPIAGKKFISDTVSIGGVSHDQKGGFVVGVELTKLIPALRQASKTAEGADPFSVLAGDTGGIQIHLRTQRALENAITMIGRELRTSYVLTYSPTSEQAGYHKIAVSVGHSEMKLYCRPGYWRTAGE